MLLFVALDLIALESIGGSSQALFYGVREFSLLYMGIFVDFYFFLSTWVNLFEVVCLSAIEIVGSYHSFF